MTGTHPGPSATLPSVQPLAQPVQWAQGSAWLLNLDFPLPLSQGQGPVTAQAYLLGPAVLR